MANQSTSPARNAIIFAGKAALYALLVAGPDVLFRGRNRAQIKSHKRQSAQRRKLPYAARLSRGFSTLTSLGDHPSLADHYPHTPVILGLRC